MIIWITGKRGAGKTTLARELCLKMDAINLDGDIVRKVWLDLDFTDRDRLENNKRTARLAKALEDQGFDVVVSTICPRYVRTEVKYISKCKWIHL